MLHQDCNLIGASLGHYLMFSGAYPSKHDTCTQYCANAGPSSATLAKHWVFDVINVTTGFGGGGEGGGFAVVIAACLGSRRSGARNPFWHSSFKGANSFFPLSRDDSILWVASVTER